MKNKCRFQLINADDDSDNDFEDISSTLAAMDPSTFHGLFSHGSPDQVLSIFGQMPYEHPGFAQ
jgi:hypothetical protein